MLSTIIIAAAVVCYFVSEAILRQYVLFRAGTQSISLSSVLEKLPAEIRDDVTKRITIAELKDQLAEATKQGDVINISLALAREQGEEQLKKKYAEIIDKYPDAPESEPAFAFYLKAPEGDLKSISIPRYQQFLKNLKEPQLFNAWSNGFSRLKQLDASDSELLEYFKPLLKTPPKYHEYLSLYTEISEIAFEENAQAEELTARKYEELCEKLPFFDQKLARRYKNLQKKKKAKTGKKKK